MNHLVPCCSEESWHQDRVCDALQCCLGRFRNRPPDVSPVRRKPNYCAQCPHAQTPHCIKGYQFQRIYPATDLVSLNNVRLQLSVFINATAA